MCHIVTCTWVIIYSFDESYDTWVMANGFENMDNIDLYITSFYYTITTITTVGYGDISPGTNAEKIFGVVIMCIGVVGFSFATGSLSSLMNTLDNQEVKFNEKITILDKIKADYNIGNKLYEEIAQSLRFEIQKDMTEVMQFI